MPFCPPVADQRFVLDHIVQIADLAGSERFATATSDLVDAVLEGAGTFAAGAWAPLCREGDKAGPQWTPDGVKMPASFIKAYREFVKNGWGAIGVPEHFGRQGDLPPSEWPIFYFRIGHEGGMEWQGSTSRKISSAS